MLATSPGQSENGVTLEPTGTSPIQQKERGQGFLADMAVPDTDQGITSSGEGSKLKRFLKRFGRRPSEENRKGDAIGDEVSSPTFDEPLTADSNAADNAGKKSGSMRSRKGSKSGGSTKGRRSDSLAGRFFQTSSTAPPIPTTANKNGVSIATATAGAATASTDAKGIISSAGLPREGFGGTSGEGLANTLAIPPDGSPAPQLSGLPTHEPIATKELMSVPATTPDELLNRTAVPTNTEPEQGSNADRSSVTAAGDSAMAASASSKGEQHGLAHHGSYGSMSIAQSRRAPSSSETDSIDGGMRGRDSLDNRTMDTGKSRASTKPTTLMSMDSPEGIHSSSYTPMAQIAQHRHGDNSTSSPRIGSYRSNNSEAYGTSIQFAPQPPLGRTASGTIVQLPGSVEEVPYANVPSLSRPHPSNNPQPGGIPADNASMLTLASSTAATSIGGGAASSRGHSHATPSLGGARSIGGSLMGERRNSSDTYASMKALPPLSRRGSDDSSRTGKSIAASATGRNSAQAMVMPAAVSHTASSAGPGAPSDRISLHRTPSQKTIATQLSIPISNSHQGLASSNNADGLSTPAASVDAAALPSITTTAPSSQSPTDQVTANSTPAKADHLTV